jgi:hypothetical protein
MRRNILTASVGVTLLALAFPVSASAHQLNEQYQAPLPLLVYVVGAALAVAISFLFVMLRNPAPVSAPAVLARHRAGWLRLLLGLVGLVAWAWIVAQALAGGSSEADVASLFLWVYGWVGVALISALIGPIWPWLDPFATLHRLLSGVIARIGLSGGGEPATYPARMGIWPAVVGFAVVIWLELVGRVGGGQTLGMVLIGYTFYTLAGMALFGRDVWRQHGEVFSVWFATLGRLAPYTFDGPPEQARLVRRPMASGLRGEWSLAELVLIALGTGSIIFDGFSQTQVYFDLFARNAPLGPSRVVSDTLVGGALLGLLVGVVLLVRHRLGTAALGAGLLPVAAGYLTAHYLTFLLYDGQRIVNALNDPLQRGDNLLPAWLGFHQPSSFLPAALVWTIQLGAVVSGHVVGAWAGHSALAEHERAPGAARQLPLAALMIVLTSVTLWSLGQAILVTPGG